MHLRHTLKRYALPVATGVVAVARLSNVTAAPVNMPATEAPPIEVQSTSTLSASVADVVYEACKVVPWLLIFHRKPACMCMVSRVRENNKRKSERGVCCVALTQSASHLWHDVSHTDTSIRLFVHTNRVAGHVAALARARAATC